MPASGITHGTAPSVQDHTDSPKDASFPAAPTARNCGAAEPVAPDQR